VQPRPPDLCGTKTVGYREAVRAKVMHLYRNVASQSEHYLGRYQQLRARV
jgi:hypothetical protein